MSVQQKIESWFSTKTVHVIWYDIDQTLVDIVYLFLKKTEYYFLWSYLNHNSHTIAQDTNIETGRDKIMSYFWNIEDLHYNQVIYQ